MTLWSGMSSLFMVDQVTLRRRFAAILLFLSGEVFDCAAPSHLTRKKAGYLSRRFQVPRRRRFPILERATGIEPVALCLGIGGLTLGLRSPHSQIRQRHHSVMPAAPGARSGHLPETVPSI